MIRTLPLPELGKLLRHIRDWNSTSNTSGIAQTVLHAILKLRRAEDSVLLLSRHPILLPLLTATYRRLWNPMMKTEAMPSTQGAVKAKKDGLREVAEALIPYEAPDADGTYGPR